MLSRVAESVFWIGRYVERAENTARLLDVALRSTRELPATFDGERTENGDLQVVLEALGADGDYAVHYDDVSEKNLASFLVLDADNPHSVLSAITNARNNARGVRETISTEMWEELNRAYLMLDRVASAKVLIDGVNEFCRQVRLASQLFHGVTDATMTQDEAWHFLQVGKFLERASMTARIMEARGGEFESLERLGRPEDVHRWLGILRSVSAYEAYMHQRVGGVQPAAVAEFLLRSRTFPRSVAFGVRRVHEELEAIDRELGVDRDGGPINASGALSARLRYRSFEEIVGGGLVKFVRSVVDDCNEVGDLIRRAYFEPAFVELAMSES